MDFTFTEDQAAVRDAVGEFLRRRLNLDLLRRGWETPTGNEIWDLWADLAGMGVHGILAPEEVGGTSMGWVALAGVLAETGRAALPLPVLETAAVGIPLLLASGDPHGLLPRLVEGTTVLTAAAGEDLFPASGRAEWFLRVGTEEAALFSRDEVTLEPVPSVDRSRDVARVQPRTDGVSLAPGGMAFEAGALGAAATLLGLGRAMLDITVGYVKDRNQFGVPIGSFQAVKHHLADVALHLEFAAPAVWAAAWEIDRPDFDPAQVARSVSLAKALSSDAATLAARKCLQCHGAMGYTDEYHLHMWMKRVWCLAPAWGSALWHRRRIGQLLGVKALASTAVERSI